MNLREKKQDIECEIESLTANIKLLEKQKVEKSWKITCLNIITFGFFKYYKNKKINNQIKRKQGASETLTKQIAENTKIKHSFKNKKLKVATEMINILQSLLSNSKEKLNNLQNKFWQEISQKLDMLLEHQIDHAKSSSSLEQDSSGYNSDDDSDIEVIPEPKENKDDDFDKYKHIYEEIKYDKNKDDILASIIKKHTPLLSMIVRIVGLVVNQNNQYLINH